jgi:hypothetical protein
MRQVSGRRRSRSPLRLVRAATSRARQLRLPATISVSRFPTLDYPKGNRDDARLGGPPQVVAVRPTDYAPQPVLGDPPVEKFAALACAPII